MYYKQIEGFLFLFLKETACSIVCFQGALNLRLGFCISSAKDFFLQFHSLLFRVGVFLVKLEHVQVTGEPLRNTL